MLTTSTRAPALPLEDRRAMIIEAVTPLLIEHGRSVTSKQIADAAGIAEGTIFRAFGDKESLIQAAIDSYLDPEVLRRQLRGLDPERPLPEKIRSIVLLLQRRFADVFRMLAVGAVDRPPVTQERDQYPRLIAAVLEPELAQLNWPAASVAQIIRLVTFATAVPQLNDGLAFTPEEIAQIILYGIAGTPQAPSEQPAPHPLVNPVPKEEPCS